MNQIIPTINVKEETEFKNHLESLAGLADLIQIDIADGTFTPWKNWAEPEKIITMPTTALFELHLMVVNPFEELKKWYKLNNIKRVVFHTESFDKVTLEVFHQAVDFDYEVCFALNPDTKIDSLKEILPNLEYVMFLGVTPGKSGQKFQKKILKKIKILKAAHKHIKVEVDGGINEGNFKDVITAGADLICMGSSIFNDNATPKENLLFFEQLSNSITL